jgi:electron transfer flavoprotein beta subunit
MKIIVCIKQILDPEIPARDFRLDRVRREALQGSADLVTSIFCENALELALQLRERAGGSITVISLGAPSAEDSLRKALAMKADTAVLVLDSQDAPRHPGYVARVLSKAIRQIGDFDIIMTGRESGDWGTGQTGGLIAEELGLPCISFVDQIETASSHLLVRRQTDDGWERFEAQPPLVVTVTNDEHNLPRIPKTRDVMMSYRQPLTRLNVDELGIGPDDIFAPYFRILELSIPVKESKCEFVAGDSLDEKVSRFADRIIHVTQSL